MQELWGIFTGFYQKNNPGVFSGVRSGNQDLSFFSPKAIIDELS